MNPMLAKAANAILRETAGIIGGSVAGAFSLLKNTILGGAKHLMIFHQEGIAFSRDMGMSLKQANAYTKALAENTGNLAFKYGVTAEAIMKVQRGLSEATNRQLMLNSSQTESFIQLNKLAGENTVAKFAEEMMQGMGAQVDTVDGAIAKAYATSAKSGLSAKKTAEIVANNLSMANKLSFRSGIDGLTRMAVQAQKIGMSLQSVESVANTFRDFDKAIEHSAQLQMLGGAAGSFGGNPLDMMYEANYDPEALQDRMTKMLSGYAQFDEKTGMSKINGLGMDFVRNIAKAMGISEDEATKIAKKNSELKFKQDRFGSRFSNRSQEEQDAIMNRSYVKDGRLFINDAKGKQHDITNGNIDQDLLKELRQFEGMSDRDIMEKQASELTTINERIRAFFESVYGKIAAKFADFIPTIQEWITKNGNNLLAKIGNGVETVAKNLPTYWKDFKNFIKDVKNYWDTTKTVLKAIGIGVAAIAAVWAGKNLMNLFKLFRSGAPAGRSGGFLKGLKNAGKSAYNWLTKGKHSNTAKQALGHAKTTFKNTGGGIIRKAAHGAKSLWNNSKLVRGLGRGNVVASAVVGTVEGASALYNYNDRKKEIENDKTKSAKQKQEELAKAATERNKDVGGAAGGLAGGLAGGAAGSLLGGIAAGAVAGTAAGTAIPGLGNAVGLIVGGIVGAAGYYLGKKGGEKVGEAISAGNNEAKAKPSMDTGGIIPGAYGKPVDMFGHGQEIVASHEDIKNVASFLKNPMIYAKPVGRNDFTYTPGRTETSTVGNHTMTVKDFNININGSLRLDGGGSSTNLDVRQLLNDPIFVNQLKDVIKESIAADINGGRKMNDLASMRGLPAQTTTWGRKG